MVTRADMNIILRFSFQVKEKLHRLDKKSMQMKSVRMPERGDKYSNSVSQMKSRF